MKVNQAHHAFLKELLQALNDAGVISEQLVAEFARRGVSATSIIQNVSSDVSIGRINAPLTSNIPYKTGYWQSLSLYQRG